MKTISIEVSDETAKIIESFNRDKKEQLSRLINVWAFKPRPILQVMEEIGEYASKQGLTKNKLDELLNDE